KGPHSPVLFYLCGEWTCGPWYLQSVADTAKSLGAAVVGLEHRFYGTSPVLLNGTTAPLSYLTMANALEDAATFERFAWSTGLLPNGRWIVVGASYAGSLAAFYREVHPELVAGSWAESAAVNLIFSSTCYDSTA